MQIIYRGKYRQRFNPVIKNIPSGCRSVLELCFGDLIIADYCKGKNISWTGFDINKSFVDHAVKKGHHAVLTDIVEQVSFPGADILIMIGSLYHFHEQLPELFLKITRSSNHIIISEPVKNLATMAGPVGYLARNAANAGKGKESFRYTQDTLLAAIYSIDIVKRDYELKILNQDRDLIVELWRK